MIPLDERQTVARTHHPKEGTTLNKDQAEMIDVHEYVVLPGHKAARFIRHVETRPLRP
jgi:hypothetical protein